MRSKSRGGNLGEGMVPSDNAATYIGASTIKCVLQDRPINEDSQQ